MLTVVQPIACILKANVFSYLDYSVVLIPSTLCWVALIISILYQLIKVSIYQKKALRLLKLDNGKTKVVNGHNFKLPTQYTFTDYTNNMILSGQIFIAIAYVSVIIKVYL